MKYKIGLIGDIVGRSGRDMIKMYLPGLKREYELDYVIANTENASGGFGLSRSNALELFELGIDVMSGGNHSFDKRDIIPLMDIKPILRPLNFPSSTPGAGIYKIGEIAFINVIGHYGININTDNVFVKLRECVFDLKNDGFKNIIIDFHGESSSEKRMAFCMLRGEITALFGTHTHIGSDDLQLQNGSFYVSDIGLSGSFDNVIGIDFEAPFERAFFGYSSRRFEVVKTKNSILQMIVIEICDGVCINAFKIRILNDKKLDDISVIILE